MSSYVEPLPKAEAYPPSILDKAEVVMYEKYLEGMEEQTLRVHRGLRNFYIVYVEGYYGSGKTFLLRKFAHTIIRKYERIIPLYFYLGEDGFVPLQALRNYIDMVKDYIKYGIGRDPRLVGLPDDWIKGNRIQVLEKTLEEVRNVMSQKDEVEVFYEVIRRLSRSGYTPLIVFDEFERVIYTGEGLRPPRAVENFAKFANGFLELTRGHSIPGSVFILATTRPLRELLELAIREERPHIDYLSRALGIDLREHIESFPMIQPTISYDEEIRITWDEIGLELWCRKYNVIIHKSIIQTIAKVLPTPRAVMNIAKIAQRTGIDVVSKEAFFNIVKPRFRELVDELERIKIISPLTKWHEYLEALLRHGLVLILRGDYLEAAKALGIKFEPGKVEERKIRQSVSNKLRKLAELGFYEARAGNYYLNSSFMAYLLNIERLPTGEIASKEEIINKIKRYIEELRSLRRKRRREE